MKLICHIGTPNTASTHIQNTCELNRGWLAERGLIYPDLLTPSANHITLFFAAANYVHESSRGYGLHSLADVERFRNSLSDVIRRQIKDAPAKAHTMIMSSEDLTENIWGIAGVKGLEKFLRPLFTDIRILVYLRRQDEALLSMYGEHLRQGLTDKTFDEFSTINLSPASSLPHLFYRNMLMRWMEVFGKRAITVRPFDELFLREGGILEDFFAEILGEDSSDLDGLVPSMEQDVSLSAPAMEILRKIQPMFQLGKDEHGIPRRPEFAKRINQLPQTPEPVLSRAQSAQIMNHFKPVNEWLSEVFFPSMDGPLFQNRRSLPEEGNLGRLSKTEENQLMMELGL